MLLSLQRSHHEVETDHSPSRITSFGFRCCNIPEGTQWWPLPVISGSISNCLLCVPRKIERDTTSKKVWQYGNTHFLSFFELIAVVKHHCTKDFLDCFQNLEVFVGRCQGVTVRFRMSNEEKAREARRRRAPSNLGAFSGAWAMPDAWRCRGTPFRSLVMWCQSDVWAGAWGFLVEWTDLAELRVDSARLCWKKTKENREADLSSMCLCIRNIPLSKRNNAFIGKTTFEHP
jgi:hypothetical protein